MRGCSVVVVSSLAHLQFKLSVLVLSSVSELRKRPEACCTAVHSIPHSRYKCVRAHAHTHAHSSWHRPGGVCCSAHLVCVRCRHVAPPPASSAPNRPNYHVNGVHCDELVRSLPQFPRRQIINTLTQLQQSSDIFEADKNCYKTVVS